MLTCHDFADVSQGSAVLAAKRARLVLTCVSRKERSWRFSFAPRLEAESRTSLKTIYCAGPEHYRTYPTTQTATRHDSSSVDMPLSPSTGANGSCDMSYGSAASVDSGPDENAESGEPSSHRLAAALW